MATVADYRKWAEECFEWARQASWRKENIIIAACMARNGYLQAQQ